MPLMDSSLVAIVQHQRFPINYLSADQSMIVTANDGESLVLTTRSGIRSYRDRHLDAYYNRYTLTLPLDWQEAIHKAEWHKTGV